MLATQTNLSEFLNQKTPTPRISDVAIGQAPKKYYEKLVFSSIDQEKTFCILFTQWMWNTAVTVTMGRTNIKESGTATLFELRL